MREAPPALPRHAGGERAAPVESPFAGGLQTACHAHRLSQHDVEALEQGITPCELALRFDRTTGELPQVDL